MSDDHKQDQPPKADSENEIKNPPRFESRPTFQERRSRDRSLDLREVFRRSLSGDEFTEIRRTLKDGRFIVFDLETTGGNPERNGITEICALKYENDKVVDTFYSLVNPKIPIPPIVRRMTGISDRTVRDAPIIGEVMPKFLEFIGVGILVSHNTIGDIRFVRHFAMTTVRHKVQNFYLCTHLLSEKLMPESKDKSLKGLARFLQIDRKDFHRAVADAEVTLELFRSLVIRLHDRGVTYIDAAIRLQGDYESAVSLGWQVEHSKLANVPEKIGVIQFFRDDKHPVFMASSMNMRRDVRKMQNWSTIPKGLLKQLVFAASIEVTTFQTLFDAMLAEAKISGTHRYGFAPSDWHQRRLTFLLVEEEARNRFRISVSQSFSELSVAAFGPVTDRKVAHQWLKSLAAELGVPYTGKNFCFSADCLPVIASALTGSAAEFLRTTKQKRSRTWNRFIPKRNKALLRDERFLRRFIADRNWDLELDSLLGWSGILVMPAALPKQQFRCVIVAGGRIVSDKEEDYGWKDRIADVKFVRKIVREISQGVKRGPSLTSDPVLRAQSESILWWIYTQANRREGVVLTLGDLEGMV